MVQNDGEVSAFFDELKIEDSHYAAYRERFGALAEFVTDYEFGKESQKLTQAEVAERAATTQSAISRFEAMKHPPTYDLLVRVSKALGDRLFLSPFGSLSISLPYDLHDKARQIAEKREQTVKELMQDYVRQGIARDGFVVYGKGSIKISMPQGSPSMTMGQASIPEAPHQIPEGFPAQDDSRNALAG